MTREPVRAHTPPNTVPFPFSMRPLIAAWKLFFFEPGEHKADPVLSAELNRGAYLVEGLAHCGACHTPRNILGAERNDRYLGGGEAEDCWKMTATLMSALAIKFNSRLVSVLPGKVSSAQS